MPAVSFDLDGTLIECAEPRERSFRRAAAALADPIEPPAVEAYRAAFRAELRSRLPERAPERPVRRASSERERRAHLRCSMLLPFELSLWELSLEVVHPQVARRTVRTRRSSVPESALAASRKAVGTYV
jgi:phosphoglycolate phosphatase-like HAD superfamily hydrolase